MELVVPKNHAAFIFISGTTKVKFRFSEKATKILTSGKFERFEKKNILLKSLKFRTKTIYVAQIREQMSGPEIS
jgi:hypothetical protein